MVEKLFSEYYSPGLQREVAHKGLRQIFENCLAFKTKLEQQEFDYSIRQSQPGTVYSSEHMNSLNYVDGEGSTVQMSIWPSLFKVASNDEELLIEPEAVWTRERNQVGDADMKDHSGVEQQIKREVEIEGDNDELSLLVA